MPPNGKETKTQKELPSPLGKITLFGRVMEFGKDEAALTVTYTDYPPGSLTDRAKTDLVAAFQGAAVKRGKVLSDREITIQGHPGREAHVDTRHGPMKCRIILVGNRLYQVIAGGKPSVISEKDVQTFMDSFKLTN